MVRPEEAAAHILRTLVASAETFSGRKFTKAVIAVPAYFNDTQRKATMSAAAIAGLQVTLINEPTAAGLAYLVGMQKKPTQGHVVVIDFGGGTLDVTIFSIEDDNFHVKATSGDTWLGGRDFDENLMKYVIENCTENSENLDFDDPQNKLLLQFECERLKQLLSTNDTIVNEEISIRDEVIDFSMTRTKFESINADLFKRCITPLEIALKDAGLKKTDITHLLLVGGTCRMPKIRDIYAKFFDNRIPPQSNIHPDHAIAIGAALSAAKQCNVNEGNLGMLDTREVVPLNLGVGLHNKRMDIVIRSNTHIPCKVEKSYQTSVDNQTLVSIPVYQGSHKFYEYNHFLGSFTITGIPQKPKGEVIIDVTFQIDQNGVLDVTAVVKEYGMQNALKIQKIEGLLSEDEIEDLMTQQDQIYEKKIAKKLLSEAKTRIVDINRSEKTVTPEIENLINRCNSMNLDDTNDNAQLGSTIQFLQSSILNMKNFMEYN